MNKSQPIGKWAEWREQEGVFNQNTVCRMFASNKWHALEISMNKLLIFGYGSQIRCTKLMLWQSRIVYCNAHSNFPIGRVKSQLTNHHKLFIERNCNILTISNAFHISDLINQLKLECDQIFVWCNCIYPLFYCLSLSLSTTRRYITLKLLRIVTLTRFSVLHVPGPSFMCVCVCVFVG